MVSFHFAFDFCFQSSGCIFLSVNRVLEISENNGPVYGIFKMVLPLQIYLTQAHISVRQA